MNEFFMSGVIINLQVIIKDYMGQKKHGKIFLFYFYLMPKGGILKELQFMNDIQMLSLKDFLVFTP